MVALAWKECKSVLVITLALALTMTAKSVVQLLVAPAILGEVEAAAPVPELLLTIAIFSGALLLVSGLEAYLDLNTLFGRIQLRMRLIHKVVEKMAETAYPNMLDTDFLGDAQQSGRGKFLQRRAHRAHLDHLDEYLKQRLRLPRLPGAAVGAEPAAARSRHPDDRYRFFRQPQAEQLGV